MNTLDFINKNKNLGYSEIRKLLYTEHFVKSIEENFIQQSDNTNTTINITNTTSNNSNNSYRIILINGKKINNGTSVYQECNGLILEYNTIENQYKVLCLPLKISNVVNFNNVNNNLKKKMCNYNVHKIYDGTVIHLYFYNNEWKISSHKGYDVTNKVFYIYTYKYIFDSIIKEKYPSFTYDMLDKNKSYTFCFKYDKYHIFNSNIWDVHYTGPNSVNHKQSSNYIIYLQSCNLKDLNETNKLIIDKSDNLPFEKESCETQIQNIEQIINICKTEYSTFNKYRISFHKIYEYIPTYGFLLKKKKNNNDSDNIIIYTTLYNNIRNTIYNNAFDSNYENLLSDDIINNIEFNIINKVNNIDESLINLNKKKQINNHIVDLNIIKKYLFNLKMGKNNNVITSLYFQQKYVRIFNFMNYVIFNGLSNIIYNNINILKNNKNLEITLKFSPNSTFLSNDNIVKKITNLVILIFNNSNSSFDFNNKDESVFNYKSLLHDFIVSENYIVLYYELYCLFTYYNIDFLKNTIAKY